MHPVPTANNIDDVTAFLEVFNAPGFELVVEECRMEESVDADGIPYTEIGSTVYSKEVITFFDLAQKPCWIDTEYLEKKAHTMVEQKGSIRTASLDEIRTLLTYCSRGERFCDGFWVDIFERRVIHAILERLLEIRKSDFTD